MRKYKFKSHKFLFSFKGRKEPLKFIAQGSNTIRFLFVNLVRGASVTGGR